MHSLRENVGDLKAEQLTERLQPHTPTDMDILMNIRLLQGYDPTHICELQLHHRDIFTIKHSKGHKLYSVVRSLGCLDKVGSLSIE